MPDETEKKTRAPLTGIALSTDVMKKISKQLERVQDPREMDRIVEYIASATRQKKLELIRAMQKDGQLPLPRPAVNTPANDEDLSI